jgi:hypothetical protein
VGVRQLNDSIRLACDRLGLSVDHDHFDELTIARKRGEGTKKADLKHLEGLWDFLTTYDDVESQIILLRKCPLNAPPVKPQTLILYVKYKIEEKGTILKDENGNEIIGKSGTPIICKGGWNAPTNWEQFKSILSMLHVYRGHSESSYYDACRECRALGVGLDNDGCMHHKGQRRVYASGNPTFSNDVREFFFYLSKSTEDYLPESVTALNPWQKLRLCQHLISSDDHIGLMLYTFVLVGIALFLREDEVSSMRFEHIHVDQSSIPEYVCIEVQGKRDSSVVYLQLWRNRTNRFLDPVNALLWWLSVSGIRTGYLFPKVSNIIENQPVVSSSVPVEYHDVSARIFGLMERLVPNENWSTHTLRKTGWLEAIWGGGGDDDIMKAARIRTIETIATYRRDSNTLKNMVDYAGIRYSHIIDSYRAQRLLSLTAATRFVVNLGPMEAMLARWKQLNPNYENILEHAFALQDPQNLKIEIGNIIEEIDKLKESVGDDPAVPSQLTMLGRQLSSTALTYKMSVLNVDLFPRVTNQSLDVISQLHIPGEPTRTQDDSNQTHDIAELRSDEPPTVPPPRDHVEGALPLDDVEAPLD